VDLAGCNLGDPGLTGLAARCTDLRHLGLANTEVTDAGLALIGEAIKQPAKL
jgi:hypothetical protein